MTKLQGEEYLDYWRTRIAKGPNEVAYKGSSDQMTAHHADKIMRYLEPFFAQVGSPFHIAELGCGWGRMTYRLADRFKESEITGVDICGEAIQSNQDRNKNSRVYFREDSDLMQVPSAELIFTCTVLQHITDDEILDQVIESIDLTLLPGGYLVLFENDIKSSSRHVRGRGVGEYIEHLGSEGYTWTKMDSPFLDHGEPHYGLLARKS